MSHAGRIEVSGIREVDTRVMGVNLKRHAAKHGGTVRVASAGDEVNIYRSTKARIPEDARAAWVLSGLANLTYNRGTYSANAELAVVVTAEGKLMLLVDEHDLATQEQAVKAGYVAAALEYVLMQQYGAENVYSAQNAQGETMLAAGRNELPGALAQALQVFGRQ